MCAAAPRELPPAARLLSVGETTDLLVQAAAGAAPGGAWLPLSVKVRTFVRRRGFAANLPEGIEFDDFLGDLLVRLMTGIAGCAENAQPRFWDWVASVAAALRAELFRAADGPGTGGAAKAEALVDRGPSPTQFVRFQELVDIEADCVAKLPEPLRRIYVLRRGRGLTYEEAARRLGGANLATLRSHFLRAREKVQAMLAARLDECGRARGW